MILIWPTGSSAALPQLAASFGGRNFFIPKYESNVEKNRA